MPVKPLIRLVDDEVDQLAALEMLLVGQGWDVAAYTGAKEFLKCFYPSKLLSIRKKALPLPRFLRDDNIKSNLLIKTNLVLTIKEWKI